jgi:hypothetical protein
MAAAQESGGLLDGVNECLAGLSERMDVLEKQVEALEAAIKVLLEREVA